MFMDLSLHFCAGHGNLERNLERNKKMCSNFSIYSLPASGGCWRHHQMEHCSGDPHSRGRCCSPVHILYMSQVIIPLQLRGIRNLMCQPESRMATKSIYCSGDSVCQWMTPKTYWVYSELCNLSFSPLRNNRKFEHLRSWFPHTLQLIFHGPRSRTTCDQLIILGLF